MVASNRHVWGLCCISFFFFFFFSVEGVSKDEWHNSTRSLEMGIAQQTLSSYSCICFNLYQLVLILTVLYILLWKFEQTYCRIWFELRLTLGDYPCPMYETMNFRNANFCFVCYFIIPNTTLILLNTLWFLNITCILVFNSVI